MNWRDYTVCATPMNFDEFLRDATAEELACASEDTGARAGEFYRARLWRIQDRLQLLREQGRIG